MLSLDAERRRLLDVHQGDLHGSQPGRFRGGVAAHIPGPDDHDARPHLNPVLPARAEEFQSGKRTFAARDRDHAGLLRPGGDDDKVMPGPDFLEILAGRGFLQKDVLDPFPDAIQFVSDNFFGDPRFRNAVGDFPAQPFPDLVDDRGMAHHPELPGHGKARGAAADHAHGFPCGRRRRWRGRLQGSPSQGRHVQRGKRRDLPRAALHAGARAQIAADRGGERRVGEGEVHRLVHAALANQAPALLNGNARGAVGLAGGKMLLVFPEGDVAPQCAGGDDIDGIPGNIRQIADQAALAQFPVPDIPDELAHGPDGLPDLLVGFPGNQDLPSAAVRDQHRIEFRASDGLEERLHVRPKPLPFPVVGEGQLRVLFTESLMGPPEEDSPPDHADAGAVTQNIFEARRIVTADHCGAAGHEFGEGIPRAPQNPELRRFEAGVVLRHRHAAGADVARHIDLALGHGVSGSVGGIAANDDAGAGIEPAHIIRDGTENVDGRAGKAHRADALSGRAEDADQKLILFPRFPEPSANAVLAVGMDFDAAVSVLDRLLNRRLEVPRFHSDACFQAGDDHGRFVQHSPGSF